MTIILRRPKLGRTSAAAIAALCRNTVIPVRNDKVKPNTFVGHDLVIRWGCTSDVPQGIRVLNTAGAIHDVNDKLGFRSTLQEVGLCPKTWFGNREFQEHIVNNNNSVMPPVVIRPSHHSQGRHLYVCRNQQEFETARSRYLEGDYYISELINKVAEYRVAVVQGRAVWVAKKTPGNPQDVAWNVARGGRFDNVRFDDWPLKAIKISIEAFNLSELDFGGVDVMVDADGKCYVLEINSAPSLTSPYRQECMAKALDYIIDNGKARIPLTAERGGYKKFIHPAIHPEAIV